MLYKFLFALNFVSICSLQYSLPQVKKPHILFFTGGNSLMPYEIYSQFIDKLKTSNEVIVIKNKPPINTQINMFSPLNFIGTSSNNIEIDVTEQILDVFNSIYQNENKSTEIIALGHSSGCSTLVNYCSKFANIKKCILIDPVNNNGDSLKKPIFNNTLIIKAEKSYKWTFEGINPIPKKAPFIPAFEMKSDIFGDNVELVKMKDYGHCDILDPVWSNIMHNSFAEGNNDRESINLYKDELISIINDFIN